MEQTFWLNNPAVLLRKEYITELWPKKDSNLEQKLNAITRLVIILGLLSYTITRNKQFVLITGVMMALVAVFYNMKHKDLQKSKKEAIREALSEGFTNPEIYKATKPLFTEPTSKNPLMNVALPEINDNPTRKPAAPAFNPIVEEEINESVKKNLDSRLFHDLGDNITFDQSMRGFYATPNTQIPNDQKGFAEFCYGTMKSCKEGDAIQCEKKNYRYITP